MNGDNLNIFQRTMNGTRQITADLFSGITYSNIEASININQDSVIQLGTSISQVNSRLTNLSTTVNNNFISIGTSVLNIDNKNIALTTSLVNVNLTIGSTLRLLDNKDILLSTSIANVSNNVNNNSIITGSSFTNLDNKNILLGVSVNNNQISTGSTIRLLDNKDILLSTSIANINSTINNNSIITGSSITLLDNRDILLGNSIANVNSTFNNKTSFSNLTVNTGITLSTGSLILPAGGSSSNPSLSFSQDSNTGIYQLAPDTMCFATNGSNRVFLNTTDISFYSNNHTFLNSTGSTGIVSISPTGVTVGGGLLNIDGFVSNSPMRIRAGTPVRNSVLNDPVGVLQLSREGTGGNTYSVSSRFALSKHSAYGTDSNSRLDIQMGYVVADSPNFCNAITILDLPRVGINKSNPGYILDVGGDINVVAGSVYRLNGVTVISNGTLGNIIKLSSLESVGYLNSLAVQGPTQLDGGVVLNNSGLTINTGGASITGGANISGGLTINSGVFAGLSGSVTAPAITFSGNTNTGLYRISTDIIGFTTGGQLRVSLGATLNTYNSNNHYFLNSSGGSVLMTLNSTELQLNTKLSLFGVCSFTTSTWHTDGNSNKRMRFENSPNAFSFCSDTYVFKNGIESVNFANLSSTGLRLGDGIVAGYTLDVNGTTRLNGVVRQQTNVWHMDSSGNAKYLFDITGSPLTYQRADRFCFRTAGDTPFGSFSASGLKIGNEATSLYPLEVTGSPSNYVTSGYFFNSSGGFTTFGTGYLNVSAKFDSYIWATTGYLASSDRRIKKNIRNLDDGEALQDLRNLKPKRFKYIDPVGKTDKLVYGFIAQEVRSVVSHAVDTKTEYIPNIYSLGNITSVSGNISIAVSGPVPFGITGQLKIITRNGGDVFVEVLSVSGNSIGISGTLPLGEVFVYGSSVDNFLILDHQQLFTLGVGAIQELDRNQDLLTARLSRIETLLGITGI